MPKAQSSSGIKTPKPGLFIVSLIVIVSGSLLTYTWFTNESFRNRITNKKTESNSQSSSIVTKNLGNRTNLVNTEKLIYDTINFRDLPVYPESWVAKYFTSAEKGNQLLAGQTADADGDGLTNKEEYFYASNPRQKDTLCEGKTDGQKCTGKTDKQLVEENISPLTGLELVKYETLRIKKQDFAILDNIQNSFENAAKEGVDFPTLYQLSRATDLSDQFKALRVITQDDNRENLLNYLNLRVNLLQDLIAQDQVSLFTEVYQSTRVEDIRKTRDKYQAKNDELRTTPTPKKFENIHRSYIFFFENIVDLLNFRAEGIEKKTLESAESKKTNQTKAVAVVWAYRSLNESLAEVDVNSIEE
jgi:hypothetical protein